MEEIHDTSSTFGRDSHRIVVRRALSFDPWRGLLVAGLVSPSQPAWFCSRFPSRRMARMGFPSAGFVEFGDVFAGKPGFSGGWRLGYTVGVGALKHGIIFA